MDRSTLSTTDNAGNRVNVFPVAGFCPTGRVAPYLTVSISREEIHLDTDENTAATLREMADRLDAYWASYNAIKARVAA